jgi:RHS repeat-associated protein
LLWQYDSNGNTTYDPANQISTVYNYLNLPSKFTKDNGATQEVVYDATGRKWQVREFLGNGDTLSRKSYIGSFEFERNSLQRAFHPTGFIQNLGAEINSSGQANGNLEGGKIISTQKLKSGVKSEYIADQSISLLPGFESDPVFHAEIKPKSGYQWNYILRDHLGNTRVVFADKNKDGLIRQDRSEALNEVLSLSNYSPFGLELGGSHQNLKQQFEYKFNGKQENGFTGLTDFGGRYLDKHLGVWGQVDPKSERFFNQSTRNFTFNNPIRFIDPDGRAPFDIILLGANNSSVTVKTDLVDVKINASGLGVDFGGNYTLSGNDVLQAAVDIGGVFDPSGALDVFGAKMSYDNGDYWGAGASLLGAGIPFVGDLAKSGKIFNGIRKIENAIEAAKTGLKEGDKLASTSRAARREAMRDAGIPTSQQPLSQSKNASGREYTYETPASYGTKQKKSVQQQTLDSSHPGQNHWEAGKVKIDNGATRMNNYGRPKLDNQKSKVNY